MKRTLKVYRFATRPTNIFLLACVCWATFLFIGCQPSARFASRESVAFPHNVSFSKYPQLKSQIDAIIVDSLFPPANLGIKIFSITKEETLYELNNRILFNPASNEKLLTAATALSRLGIDYPLTTTIGFDTNNTPTIYVKGYGDPLVTTADIDSAARLTVSMLPKGKSWTLAGDVSYFDDEYWGKGWMWDDEPDPTSMFISPLSINGNTISVICKPGEIVGEPVSVSTDPPTDFVELENTAITVVDSVREPLKVTRRWKERANIVDIQGEMQTDDSSSTEVLTVWQPELYFLNLFAEQLRNHGIDVVGSTIDTLTSTATQITSYSHRLDTAITYLNKTSDNLSAENILKVISAHKHGAPGTSMGGVHVVREFMAGKGIDTMRTVQADGSGLSRYNLISPNGLVELLVAAYNDTLIFPAFYNSLPIAGRDGSLSSRMRNSTAGNNLRAKTGTFSGVSCLSGYVRTIDGEMLAFSIMMQGIPGSVRPYRQVQDRIGIFLSSLTRSGIK